MDISGMLGGGGISVPQTPAYETYDAGETTVLTLSSRERMRVDIPVDELDVLDLTTGAEAVVTLDALKGQSFTGTVTKINRTGINSGGNTKFNIQVTLPGTAEMLPGMNASVSVVTDSREAAITVPAAALWEDGSRTYVYTGYSEKDDTLTNPVEVTTGVSGADTVEILSGLKAGDTYYYRFADSITFSFASAL